jgi:DNA polymerase elongation subunit (family B)
MAKNFYTNFFLRKGKVYIRGYSMGLPFSEVIKYEPYLFINSKDGDYKTVFGQPVSKVDFNSVWDAREFLDKYKDVPSFPVHGSTNFAYVYVNDRFKGEIEFDKDQVSINTLDIECESDKGFPDPEKAEQMITSITLRKRGRSAVFSYYDFKTDDPNIHYTKCENEFELLTLFLQVWRSDAWIPDVVTGWYVEFFDIPYLVNRIKKILGEDAVKKLSPWGFVDEKEMSFRGKTVMSYNLLGLTVLDYHQLYRKFSFKNHESYKLNYIAHIELGEKKIDYSEYQNLTELLRENPQKYIEYNIHDCVLVDNLDKKLDMIGQVMSIAYSSKINYIDTLATVRAWDTIIHNDLMEKKIVVKPMQEAMLSSALVGGYVKDPQIGKHRWVMSFDLDSLYPHLIMQYNISPETFIQRLSPFPDVTELLNAWPNIDRSVSTAANGCTYTKAIQGFLPAIMERKYANRKIFKDLSNEYKSKYEKTKSPEDLKLKVQYHNRQLAEKIILNAGYGALANQYFRWFDFNMAEAITMSGQLAIRWVERKMNEYMNRLLKTNDVDYVIASDTDSIYLNFDPLVQRFAPGLSDHKTSEILDAFAKDKIAPLMENIYAELKDHMGAFEQRMKMKRETIASTGIWKAKKMYMLNAIDIEGTVYKVPELKIQGIEAVKSSTPAACREAINQAIKIMMTGELVDLRTHVSEFRKKFENLPFEDIAKPSSVNGLRKYWDRNSIYKSGTQAHIKGSLLFNHLLKEKGLTNVQPIGDGDKIKFAYLKKPNPIKDTVISVAEYLPKEFGLDKYVDRKLQFEKTFVSAVDSIASVVGWDLEEKGDAAEFFE